MNLEVLRFSSEKIALLGRYLTSQMVIASSYVTRLKTSIGKIRSCTKPEYQQVLTKSLFVLGGFHSNYQKRFSDIHVGMLWINDVPNFEHILIHCGNDDDDTSGCLLVGETQTANNLGSDGFVGGSTRAYRAIYPKLAKAAKENNLTITYTDFDTV